MRRLFGKVHDDVLQMTGGNQEPRNYDSLGGDDFFLTPPDAAPASTTPPTVAVTVAPPTAPDAKTIEMKYWETVDIHDQSQVQAYLNQYPSGLFSNLARAKLAAASPSSRLASKAVETSPPTPPRPEPTLPASSRAPAEPINTPHKFKGADNAAPVELASIAPPNAVPLMTPVSPANPPRDTMTALPPRPTLQPLPPVQIPTSFCSARDRNTFHSATYLPANQIAQHNNELAIQYLNQIGRTQRQYASAGSGFANVVTREFLDFKSIADNAFTQSDAYAKMYDAIMAVPIAACR